MDTFDAIEAGLPSPTTPYQPYQSLSSSPSPTTSSNQGASIEATICDLNGVELNRMPIPMVQIEKSPILKQAAAEFIDCRIGDINKLKKIVVQHKKYRGNFWNLVASYLNVFISQENLTSFDSTTFALKIQEIQFNSILTQEDFSSFLLNLNISIDGASFRALLHKLDSLYESDFINVSNKFKISIELNILLWVCKHFNLNEHLWIINDMLSCRCHISPCQCHIDFDIVYLKQDDSRKTRRNQLTRVAKL